MPKPLYLRPVKNKSDLAVAQPDVFIGGITADNRGALADELKEVLAKLDKLLAEAGSSKEYLVHLTILLSQEGMYPQAYIPVCCSTPSLLMPSSTSLQGLLSDAAPGFKDVYEAWVPKEPPPRTIQWVLIDKVGAKVEITAIASRIHQ